MTFCALLKRDIIKKEFKTEAKLINLNTELNRIQKKKIQKF